MALSRELIKANMDEKTFSSSLPDHLKQWVADFKKEDFFLEGLSSPDKEYKTFRNDYIDRTFLSRGKHFLSFFPSDVQKNNITDKQILNKLSDLYGSESNAKAILQANTQQVGMVVYNLFLARISCSNIRHDEMGALKYILYPNDNKIIDLVFDAKKNLVKLNCTYEAIPVTNGKEEGALHGPITAEFVLRKKNGKAAFQFESLTQSIPLVTSALSGKMIHLNDIIISCIPSQPARLSFWGRVKATMNEIAEEFDQVGDIEDRDLLVIEKQEAECSRTGLDISSETGLKIGVGAGIGAAVMAIAYALEYANSAEVKGETSNSVRPRR